MKAQDGNRKTRDNEKPSSQLWRSVYGLAVVTALLVGACEDEQHPVACGTTPEMRIHKGETETATACFEDANGDVLTYSAQSSNPGVATVAMSGTTVTITAVAQGQATVTVTATDPGGLAGTSQIRVVVPNRPPVARGEMPGIVIKVHREASVAGLESYFADPDGDALTYAVTSSDLEVAAVTITGTSLRVAGVSAGSATITVTATDPGGAAATQQASVTVEANRAPRPEGNIPDVTLGADGDVVIGVSDYFTDPDGDTLTYTAASSSLEVVTVTIAGPSLTVAGVAQGQTTVTVTATDPFGLSATQAFVATVDAGLLVFRDDFTEPFLNTSDWGLGYAEARVDNGILELTQVVELDSRYRWPGVAIKRLNEDPSLGHLGGDWTINVRMGRLVTQDPQDVFIRVISWPDTCTRWHPQCFPGFGFFIGSGNGSGNWAFALWEFSDKRAGWLVLDGFHGESDAINDASGELTEITLTFETLPTSSWEVPDGRITVLAGTTKLFEAEVAGPVAEGLSNVSELWLSTRGDGEGATALFDWISVAGQSWKPVW